MTDSTVTYRIAKVASELNISIHTIADHLRKKGYEVEEKPTSKITGEMYDVLVKDFHADKKAKEESRSLDISISKRPKIEETVEKPAEKPKTQEKEEGESEILIKNTVLSDVVKKEEGKPVIKAEPEENPEPEKKKPAAEEKPVKEQVKETPKAEKEEKDEEDNRLEVKVVGKINLDEVSGKRKSAKKETKEAPVEKPAEIEKKVEEPVAEKEPVKEITKPKVEEPVAEEKPVKIEPVKEEKKAPEPEPQPVAEVKPAVPEVIKPKMEKLQGLTIKGKIELPVEPERRKPQPIASSDGTAEEKKKRKRKTTTPGDNTQGGQGGGQFNRNNNQGGQNNRPGGPNNNRPGGQNNRPGQQNRGPIGNQPGGRKPYVPKEEITDKQIQDKIKSTMAKLAGNKPGGSNQRQKLRREKRDQHARFREEEMMEQELASKTVKVTEFVTANELAKMMDVPVTSIITTCFNLGMMVSINQRLDAEAITIVADEFGYDVEFVSAEVQENNEEEQVDDPADLKPRPPIVTVMGHVDHGKTSLLDYVRKANVIAGEAGGITQHIGAYEVTLENGKKITFLDTPGHEAFTAMRARGAKVTDIVIVVIAADDNVMPQTKEAISHAQAANVPIIFAINKIDREGANPDRIREQLAAMNILVEEWGGKYQCQEISAKKGLNIDTLLEKVLLEAEMLDLKANPDKRAVGAVIEARLDKGRGIIATVLIEAGTIRVGDPMLAGYHSGKVRALLNERGQKIKEAGPSTPAMILGFNGTPQAGDRFMVTATEQEAKEIATKRQQLQREQGLRTNKHITLDEIGRRLAIGNFRELKLIVKGDVDGSVEALSDSLLKLSTEEIAVNVIHKSVGQITESDVLLASASDAIIIGFQVRPSAQARKLAEAEEIDIRSYSIIYTAIEEIKAAMEGMLAPQMEEKVVCNVDVREVFKISKVGTIAGCMVTDGKIHRNTRVRVIRDGVVMHTGELDSLKRFKDDVKEVNAGYECGLSLKNFNDIQVGDQIEGYEEVEVKRKL